jgi:hypothetical protein
MFGASGCTGRSTHAPAVGARTLRMGKILVYLPCASDTLGLVHRTLKLLRSLSLSCRVSTASRGCVSCYRQEDGYKRQEDSLILLGCRHHRLRRGHDESHYTHPPHSASHRRLAHMGVSPVWILSVWCAFCDCSYSAHFAADGEAMTSGPVACCVLVD